MSRPRAPLVLVLSCEHGGNAVPPALRTRFRAARAALQGHRGWDRGALFVARHLARTFGAPLFAVTTSRLVCDTNRSASHPRVFSEWTRDLPEAQRQRLLATLHAPHRERVRREVARRRAEGATVLHVSVHSFTPELDGDVRRNDVGVLFDPARRGEGAFHRRWKRAFAAAAPRWKVLANEPYRGTSDGLTTALRRRFSRGYLGLELELNQRLFAADPRRWRPVAVAVAAALAAALAPDP